MKRQRRYFKAHDINTYWQHVFQHHFINYCCRWEHPSSTSQTWHHYNSKIFGNLMVEKNIILIFIFVLVRVILFYIYSHSVFFAHSKQNLFPFEFGRDRERETTSLLNFLNHDASNTQRSYLISCLEETTSAPFTFFHRIHFYTLVYLGASPLLELLNHSGPQIPNL